MKIENVIRKDFSYSSCVAHAKSNEQETGNKTFVKHLGASNSHSTINYQDYIVVEIVNL